MEIISEKSGKIQIVFELIFTLEKSFRDKHSVGFVCYAYMQLHII